MEKGKIWVGRMTREQERQGGIWTIGNQPYNSDPNYPGRNDGSLLVKSWVANPDKYGKGKYALKDRLDDNKWEFVHVFDGCLECQIAEKEKTFRYSLYPSDGGVEITPENVRGWYLPIWCQRARGIAVCRSLPAYPPVGGWGVGYEFAIWDTDTRWERLIAPRNLNRWSLKYIEVFVGAVELGSGLIAREGRHVFYAPGEVNLILPVRRSCGAVIYIA